MIKLIIFDLDGVLVDAREIHYEALNKALMTDKLPIGLFFKEAKETYEDGIPQIANTPLVDQDINNVDIKPLLDKFK